MFLLTINTATATPNRRTLILDAVDIAATHFMSITSHYQYVCSFHASFCSGPSCASNIWTDLEDKTKQPDNVGHKHAQVKSLNVTNNPCSERICAGSSNSHTNYLKLILLSCGIVEWWNSLSSSFYLLLYLLWTISSQHISTPVLRIESLTLTRSSRT